jgi:UDP-N-acetylglucosamine enolpyruvyl transferase
LSVTSTYSAGIYIPGGATVMVSTGPVLTAALIAAGPNATHASTLNPAVNPALASVAVGSSVSGAGTTLLTCTGTNFVQGCRIWVNNVEKTTTFASATSLTATIDKKREAGTWPVDVKLGGVPVPSTRTITWT